MAIYACKINSAGAENGRSTWVRRSGADGPDRTQSASISYEGDFYWQAGDLGDCIWDQEVTLEAGLLTEIDTGTAVATASAYHRGASGDSDRGFLYLEAYDSGHVLLDSNQNAYSDPVAWTLETVVLTLPAGTRYLRIGTNNDSVGTGSANNNLWDNFALTIEGDFPAEVLNIKEHQAGALAWVSQPAEEVYENQAAAMVFGAAETSNGTYDVYAYQLGAYAWVRPNGDRRELRAWTFKQDDHEFYGIQLGSEGTLVWDKLTNMWCQWKSPGFVYWRAEDVTDWEGYNLAGDTESGKIFQIDPTGRLDYGTTPITSKIVGYLTHRFRQQVPCFIAELAVSEGQPPTGFDNGTVGITLRTSTDDGENFVNHGEVVGEGISEDITVRWYGLGLMEEPGMLFEITDTGYARRIDGLDIEVKEA